jgi:predicted metalloprotease with PDZ domain
MLPWLGWFACQPTPSIPVPVPSVPPGPGTHGQPPADQPMGSEGEVSYTVSFPDRAAHRATVQLRTRCGGDGILWMAAWTPGSYLIRDYGRWVSRVEAGGVPARKIAGNRWQVSCEAGSPLEVSYEITAASWSVREAFVDPDLAVLNGAALFLIPTWTQGPFTVELQLPEDWQSVQTAMPEAGEGRFRAPDIDVLLDSPMLVGNPVLRSFVAGGVSHVVVLFGETEHAELDALAQELQQLVPEALALWGTPPPYERYHFLWLLGTERGGGLEHAASTLLMSTPAATRQQRGALLALASHELLHAWNGKRLRPVGLGPFEYERPVHTPSLWLVEGVTSYYDDLVLARAGLSSEDSVLADLSEAIRSVQTAPGRQVESLADASRHAWTGHYRRDADSSNRSVDYYDKGAVVAFLLDARVRRASQGSRSLDDVMRALWARHAEVPYQEEDVRRVVAELASDEDAAWLASAVEGTDELDYGGALQWFGLRWVSEGEALESPAGWWGTAPAEQGGKLVFTEVLQGTPAAAAGLSAGDELLGVGGYRVTGADLADRLRLLGPGWRGELLVARRGRLRTLEITLDADPKARWTLEADPGASPLAVRRRRAWLAGD